MSTIDEKISINGARTYCLETKDYSWQDSNIVILYTEEV